MSVKRKQVQQYQYEPLVTPSKWTGDEHRFAVRLTQILDDLHAKFNAIRSKLGIAEKLETPRTIRTKLDSTEAASFDGTKNVTPGVSGTLPIANGGTGATSAAKACENLGAVQKSGDTMTGDLAILKATPQLFLRNEEGVLGVVQGLKNASNTNVSLRFAAKGKGTSFYEYFSLPYANNDLTANAYYSLLTSKAPVTIGQGGTGATTAAAARTALGLDRVTLWSGTAAAGTTVTLKESIDNFSRLAVLISNANSEVLSWTSGKTVAMFSRTALASDDTEGFGTYLARIEISSTNRTSATVASTRYVTHKASGHSVNTSLGAITAIYGWR